MVLVTHCDGAWDSSDYDAYGWLWRWRGGASTRHTIICLLDLSLSR